MDHSFILHIIINGLLQRDKHTVRHGGCKNEENKHTCPLGAKTLEDAAIKTSPCNTVGSGAMKDTI